MHRLLAALLLLGGFALAEDQPRYRGKTAREWIVASADADERVRVSAAAALGMLRDEAGVAPLIRLLGDASPSVRMWAAHALIELGPAARAAEAALLERTEDASPFVRGRAAWALGAIGADPARAVPALVRLLSDTEPWPRANAAQGLELLGPDARAAVPALLERLDDPELAVRQYTADALAGIGAREAIPRLRGWLESSDARARIWGAAALVRLGERDALTVLVGLARAGDQGGRVNAALKLGEIGRHPETLAVLVERLRDDESDVVRSMAAQSLGRLADRADVEVRRALELTVKDDPPVSHHAREALARIDEP